VRTHWATDPVHATLHSYYKLTSNLLDYHTTFKESQNEGAATAKRPRKNSASTEGVPENSGNANPAKKRREETTERGGGGHRDARHWPSGLDHTATCKTRDSASHRTDTGTATGTATRTVTLTADTEAAAAASAALRITTPPASEVRRLRGREVSADAGAPEAADSTNFQRSKGNEEFEAIFLFFQPNRIRNLY
jgi:hypothetical protein